MAYLIIYMGIMAGWSGGSLKGHSMFGKLTFLPEVLLSLGFLALCQINLYYGLVSVPWAYIFFQTGHANALPWGDGNHNPNRSNTLSPVIKWLSDRLGIDYYSRNYARLFMAVKGFLITLPVGGLGFFFFPLGYEIGHRTGRHVVSEVLSGAGIGLSIYLRLI